VLACLTCGVADTALELLDWRYFYVDDDRRCHVTCGVVRLVARALLRRQKKLSDLLDPRTVMSGKNPAALGFHVEYLIVLHFWLHGCLVAGPEFGETRMEESSGGDMPTSLEPDFEGSILYRPASFNFRAVDAILVHREKGNAKAVIVGIQVTIAGAHSDLEEKFFRRWEDWQALMNCENIEFRFLWIVENRRNRKREIVVPAKTRKLNGRTIVVAPQYTSIETTVKEVDLFIGRRLEWAREWARG
jgi:hypothetical protein